MLHRNDGQVRRLESLASAGRVWRSLYTPTNSSECLDEVVSTGSARNVLLVSAAPLSHWAQ